MMELVFLKKIRKNYLDHFQKLIQRKVVKEMNRE
jgi:hypothetical protein